MFKTHMYWLFSWLLENYLYIFFLLIYFTASKALLGLDAWWSEHFLLCTCHFQHQFLLFSPSYLVCLPFSVLSEWNCWFDGTVWQNPEADWDLVQTSQKPRQALSFQEVWRSCVRDFLSQPFHCLIHGWRPSRALPSPPNVNSRAL